MKVSPGSINRISQSITAALAVGILSLAAAQIIDAATGARIPELQILVRLCLLAGLTCATGCYAALWLSPRMAATLVAGEVSALLAATVGFVFFLVPILIAVPESTGRWLTYMYALSLLFWWLALRSGVFASHNDGTDLALWLNREHMVYAPFAAAGLALLSTSLICALFGLRDSTIQLANWAFGFLLLSACVSVVVLTVQHFTLTQRLGRAAGIILPIAILAFFPVARFVEANSQTAVERQLVTDVYPRMLAQKLGEGDMLISDSAGLRLNNIPRLGASLTVNPDERGLEFWEDLARALDNRRRVFWVTVPGQSHDTKGLLSTFLKTNGCLDAISTTSLPVRVYTLNKPLSQPRVLPSYLAERAANAFESVRVDFGRIEMTGLSYERRACTHDSVAAAIRWNLATKTANPLKVSLFLHDAQGRRVQAQDFYIEDSQQRHTDKWEQGTAYSYFLLAVPQGTPPGIYTLGAGVYATEKPEWLRVGTAEGVTLHTNYVELGQMELYRGQDMGADPWRTRADSNFSPADVTMQEGLELDGYQVQGQTVIPGESIRVGLRWRAARDGLPSYSTRVALRQGDAIVVEQSGLPVDGTYSTDMWRAGEYVTEWRDLRVPPETTGQSARLEASAIGGSTVWLADIKIEPIERTYQMPSAALPTRASFRGVGELVGYDLPESPASFRRPVELTLYWKSGALINTDYVVFAQLVSPAGRLVAQSDSQPATGARPTRSWLPGEVVTDHHSLQFRQQDYTGEAKLIVGLYDPETGKRVPIEGIADDYHVISTTIQVVGQ